eukprot:SM000007S20912  [mRNA]  locus=s7:924735:927529:+ [translate_table: standard]
MAAELLAEVAFSQPKEEEAVAAPPSTPPSSLHRSEDRIASFEAELSRDTIQLAALQALAWDGIPEDGSLRSTLLLRYLPVQRETWAAELRKKRAEYAQFQAELMVNPSEISRRRAEEGGAERDTGMEEVEGALRRLDVSNDDHPLSTGTTSDNELVEQIERDVLRTHPDMPFFNSGDSNAEANKASLRRSLFIYAKLNPGIQYVQGMNEVLAPLLYVFRTDPDPSVSEHAEADSFFCFVALLAEFRDHFVQKLDNSVVGIKATLSRLSLLLKSNDEELWQHLEEHKVDPHFYAFRWITLLLTQEFSFEDSLRLWDSLLSSERGPMDTLLHVCCAMLLCIRSRLLAGDFTTNLKLLQHYPRISIETIIEAARHIRT